MPKKNDDDQKARLAKAFLKWWEEAKEKPNPGMHDGDMTPQQLKGCMAALGMQPPNQNDTQKQWQTWAGEGDDPMDGQIGRARRMAAKETTLHARRDNAQAQQSAAKVFSKKSAANAIDGTNVKNAEGGQDWCTDPRKVQEHVGADLGNAARDRVKPGPGQNTATAAWSDIMHDTKMLWDGTTVSTLKPKDAMLAKLQEHQSQWKEKDARLQKLNHNRTYNNKHMRIATGECGMQPRTQPSNPAEVHKCVEAMVSEARLMAEALTEETAQNLHDAMDPKTWATKTTEKHVESWMSMLQGFKSVDDMNDEVKDLGNARASTGCTREHLLHAGPQAKEAVFLLTKSFFAGCQPEHAKVALTSSSMKDDEKANATRPMTSLKLCEKLCDSRNNKVESGLVSANIDQVQYAAKGEVMDTCNFITQAVLDDAESAGKNVTLHSSDLQQAYDSLTVAMVCVTYASMGCPPPVVALKAAQLRGHTRRIITNMGTTPMDAAVRLHEGCPQGGCSSSTMFIAVNTIITRCVRKCGGKGCTFEKDAGQPAPAMPTVHTVGNVRVNITSYMDDSLMFDDEQDRKKGKAVQALAMACTLIGIGLNITKTKFVASAGSKMGDKCDVTAAEKDGQLQRASVKRVDTETTLKVLGVFLAAETSDDYPDRNWRNKEHIKNIVAAFTHKMHRNKQLNVLTAMTAIRQSLYPALKTNAMATQPTTAWIDANVDRLAAQMLMKRLRVTADPQELAPLLLQTENLLGVGLQSFESVLAAETVSQVLSMLNETDRLAHRVVKATLQKATLTTPKMNGILARMLARMKQNHVSVHKTAETSTDGQMSASKRDVDVFQALSAPKHTAYRGLNQKEMADGTVRPHAKTTPHVVTKNHVHTTITTGTWEKTSFFVHATHNVLQALMYALFEVDTKIGGNAKTQATIVAIDCSKMETVYDAMDQTTREAWGVHAGSRAHNYSVKAQELLLLPINREEQGMQVSGHPAIIGSVRLTDTARITKPADKYDLVAMLSDQQMSELADLNKCAMERHQQSPNATPPNGTQTFSMGTDASVQRLDQQFVSQMNRKHEPAAVVTAHAETETQNMGETMQKTVDDMNVVLKTSKAGNDDSDNPALLMWEYWSEHSTTSPKGEPKQHYPPPPGACSGLKTVASTPPSTTSKRTS